MTRMPIWTLAALLPLAAAARADLVLDDGEVHTIDTLDGTIDGQPAAGFDGVAFNFPSVYIGPGTTLIGVVGGAWDDPARPPLIIVAEGDVTIEGTLDVSGDDGELFWPGGGGPGGFSGGLGGWYVCPWWWWSGADPEPGNGPGGGGTDGTDGGNAGHLVIGEGANGGAPYASIPPTIGGSGGGGAFDDYWAPSGGGGGGAVRITSLNGAISIQGVIDASGGNGAIFNGQAGSGSGGTIELLALVLPSVTGVLDVRGGEGASPGRTRVAVTCEDDIQCPDGTTCVGGVCESDCSLADVNGDTQVDADDLVQVVLSWGPCLPGSCSADINGDGRVGDEDLDAVIMEWGPCVDCNENGIADLDDVAVGTSPDCNGNLIPDECELGGSDCNGNAVPDYCDLASGSSGDLDGNGVPDECQAEDCNDNGVPDLVDIGSGVSSDCDANLVPDECDIASGSSTDCNANGVPDGCDIADGTSEDCNANGIPDDCESDCNCNGIDDQTDIESGSPDCNGNGVPDDCDLAAGVSEDCNENGVPDVCDIDAGDSDDCNWNGIPDECQPPVNDTCGSSMTIVGGGEVEFTTCGASEEGPEEPACPLQADVWLRFLAPCDGTMTVTVDADFLATVAAYDAPCPSAPGAVIACGEGQISYAVTAGTLYRLRVGSSDGATGSGTITLTCE